MTELFSFLNFIKTIFPKTSFDVYLDKGKTLNLKNTSGRNVEVLDIHINYHKLNDIIDEKGSEVITRFKFHENQSKNISISLDKTTIKKYGRLETVQIHYQTKWFKRKKFIEYSL